MRKRIHIIYRGGKWALKKDGGKRASFICNTARQCILVAISNRYWGWEVILHKEDGSVEEIFMSTSPLTFRKECLLAEARGLYREV